MSSVPTRPNEPAEPLTVNVRSLCWSCGIAITRSVHKKVSEIGNMIAFAAATAIRRASPASPSSSSPDDGREYRSSSNQ